MKRYTVLCSTVLLFVAACTGPSEAVEASDKLDMSVDDAKVLIQKQEDQHLIPKSIWKQLLSTQQYNIMWENGTERAFTGEYLDNKAEGVYVTAGCEIPVFSSEHKYKSGTGWPSFWDAVDEGNIVLKDDSRWGMKRTEILSKCGEHLGHVFDDGPEPTGLRYCINSLALKFIPSSESLEK